MIVLSHPTGNANVRHAALGLHRAGLLDSVWTGLRGELPLGLHRLLPRSLRREFERRAFPPGVRERVHTHPFREALRLGSGRLGWSGLSRHETGFACVDAVYRSLDRRVARALGRPGLTAVYAYEDGAAFSFRAARDRGLVCLYEQPIGYWRAARELLEEEAAREPAWAATLSGNRDSAAKNARKDEELGLADVVFAASSFTRATLARAPRSPGDVVVIPYGAPTPAATPPRATAAPGAPLRVLYVGSLGQRKGLSYLFAAVAALGPAVALTVIGRRPDVPCPPLDAALARCRYLASCPHAEVLAEMARHDVFVFPSLFEGFGLVLLEAMALGLPIVATQHTAAPDLIADGDGGYLVPIRDATALEDRLLRLHRDRELLHAQSEAARARAAGFTWETYETRLAQACAARLKDRR